MTKAQGQQAVDDLISKFQDLDEEDGKELLEYMSDQATDAVNNWEEADEEDDDMDDVEDEDDDDGDIADTGEDK